MIGGAMKSLFKSGVRDIKNKFSKRGEDDQWPTPLGLRLGAAIDIDTLPLRMHADELHVELPQETILIVAQGFVDLGDDTYVHRYYSANDTMIQILSVNGVEDQHVEEITLYVPYESIYPGSEGEWALWTAKGGKMGAPTFRFDDGTQYEPVRRWVNRKYERMSAARLSKDRPNQDRVRHHVSTRPRRPSGAYGIGQLHEEVCEPTAVDVARQATRHGTLR